MDAEIFRSFLISIGFKTDAKSEKQFRDSLKQVSDKAIELGKGMVEVAAIVTGAAATIGYAVEKIADSFDRAYYASQRTNSSIGAMKALGYAASQMGGTAEAASSSLENLARFMRDNANGVGILESIGVQSKDASGKLLKTDQILLNLQRRLHEMPSFQAAHFGSMFGLDENIRLMDPDQFAGFVAQYAASANRLGLSLSDAGAAGNRFMVAWRRMQSEFGLIADKFGSTLLDKFGGYLDRFNTFLDAHAADIGAFADRAGRDLGQFTDILLALGQTAWDTAKQMRDGWNSLGPVVKLLTELLAGGLVAALVAVGIAAFPLTSTVLAISAAIGLVSTGVLALINDFNAWKTGSKSFVNWGEWKPEIDAVIAGAKQIGDLLERINLNLHIGEAAQNFGNVMVLQIKRIIHEGLAAAILMEDLATGNWADARKRASQMVSGDFSADVVAQPSPIGGTPRGIRNNNPGNIEYGDFALREGATGRESAGRFATFGTAEAGLRALADLLKSYAAKGIDSIRAIISKYAPSGENDTGSYIAGVAKSLGVGADSHLNLASPQTLANLMSAIVQQENGANPYAGAIASIAGGSPITIQQTNTVTVTGVSGPQQAADAVGKAITASNTQLRNLKPVLQ